MVGREKGRLLVAIAKYELAKDEDERFTASLD
jgi:hypothetical protein